MALIEPHILTQSPYLIDPSIALVSVDASDDDVDIRLPLAAQNAGREITIRLRTGGNVVTLRFSGDDVLDGGVGGEPSLAVAQGKIWVKVISDGVSSWWAMSGDYFDND